MFLRKVEDSFSTVFGRFLFGTIFAVLINKVIRVKRRMMKIIEMKWGKFPQVDQLNPKFIPGSTRLKATLEISPDGLEKRDLKDYIRELTQLFPSLKRHRCENEHGLTTSFQPKPGLKQVDEATDIAHLIEHMVIDLQCSLGQMRSCSGITCAYWTPENRYDIFVECRDRKVGVFALRLAGEIAEEILIEGKFGPKYKKLLQLARFIQETPGVSSNLGKLSSALRWKENAIKFYLKELIRLGYL